MELSLSPHIARGFLAQSRRDPAQMPSTPILAKLMEDYTAVPAPSSQNCPTANNLGCEKPMDNQVKAIALEIKPKCGFLPDVTKLAPESLIKARKSKFWMQQELKFRQVRQPYSSFHLRLTQPAQSAAQMTPCTQSKRYMCVQMAVDILRREHVEESTVVWCADFWL